VHGLDEPQKSIATLFDQTYFELKIAQLVPDRAGNKRSSKLLIESEIKFRLKRYFHNELTCQYRNN
jgi:hypothetical protein